MCSTHFLCRNLSLGVEPTKRDTYTNESVYLHTSCSVPRSLKLFLEYWNLLLFSFLSLQCFFRWVSIIWVCMHLCIKFRSSVLSSRSCNKWSLSQFQLLPHDSCTILLFIPLLSVLFLLLNCFPHWTSFHLVNQEQSMVCFNSHCNCHLCRLLTCEFSLHSD